MISTGIYFYKNTDVEAIDLVIDENKTITIYEFIVNGKNFRACSWLEAKTIIDNNKK